MKHGKSNKKPMTKKEFKTEVKNFIMVIIGSIILGLGTGIFLVPFNIIAGGVTGIGIAVNEWLTPILPEAVHTFLAGFSLNIMDVYVACLTWFMFFLGWIILG